MSFLRIENPVKFLPTINTIKTLGVSDKRGSDGFIGQFGSGFKYSLALFARHGLLDSLKVCIGKNVFTFAVVPEEAMDSNGYDKIIHMIVMKQQGGGTLPLNMSAEFGINDWKNIGMGLREFVSNAYDGAHNYDGTYDLCKIEEVEDNQCRAADGLIRVYVKMTDDVRNYFDNLGKKFLMANASYDKEAKILPNRTREAARIYRKGVQVGEFGDRSLFHYNLDGITLNESREVAVYEANQQIAKAIMHGSVEVKTDYLFDLLTDKKSYESQECQVQILNPSSYVYSLSEERRREIFAEYKQAYHETFGDAVICFEKSALNSVKSKGLPARLIEDLSVYMLLKDSGVKTYLDVLDKHEAAGRVVSKATDDVKNCFRKIWKKLDLCGFVGSREEPSLKCFNQPMNGSNHHMGFYDDNDNTVYIHTDYSQGDSAALNQTMLEEIAHHITGARDETRDFQDFAFRVAIAFMSQSATA